MYRLNKWKKTDSETEIIELEIKSSEYRVTSLYVSSYRFKDTRE